MTKTKNIPPTVADAVIRQSFKKPQCRPPWPPRLPRRGASCSTRVPQALGCLHFDPNDARRQAWNGKWPGEDDCERLDFFVNSDPDFPDLNRLFTDCVWDADTGRWERKQ